MIRHTQYDRGVVQSKGLRLPAAPIICTIYFENQCIATFIPYAINAFELWEKDGTSPIVSYPTDYEFVEYISAAQGLFLLHLVAYEQSYFGYLEL